jgi:radical SAM superfamily enzyme YgiQ (UPF0313 family)
LISIIKGCRKDIPVIVGDNGASFSYHIYLEKAGADIAVIGEGDITIKEVMEALKANTDLCAVSGIALKKDGTVYRTAPRKRIDDLDGLPYPAWDLFPAETYIAQKVLGRNEGKRGLGVSATRGCPYQCKFCYPSFGRIVKMRLARSIVEEVKYLKKKYGIEYTGFSDDLFIINRKRVEEFCRLMIDEKIGVGWCTAARVNLVDEELLRLMRGAGCNWLGYGIESANQRILDEMKKGVTVEQARRAVRLTKKLGFVCSTSYIVGMPSETPGSIEDTVRFILKEDLPFFGLFYATPYPGCELYDDLIRSGRVRDEEEFIMKLGDAKDFVINLTSIPDAELIRLKERAEAILWEQYGTLTQNILNRVPRPVGYLVRFIWCVRFWGLLPAVRKALKKIHYVLSRHGGYDRGAS